MRRLRALATLVALLLLRCGLASVAPGQTERILDYHSDVELRTDGTLVVQETIQVESHGWRIRHGIYRDFPTHYRDRLGNAYIVGFDLLGATRDGQPEISRVENRANGKRIYLGNPNSLLSPGRYTYAITYTTNRQLGFFHDHDELFWNVTGNGWVFPIEHASATVRLPAEIPADRVELSGYTGPQGSMAQDLIWKNGEDGTVQFDSQSALGPSEGMTILVKWPKGYFIEPTWQDKIGYVLTDNQSVLILLAGFLLVGCYYMIAWYLVGRDPAPGVIVAEYEPPAGYSPAAIRELVRMKFDNKGFTAAVLDMAVKGYLTIQEDFGTYTLKRTTSGGQDLFPEEQLAAGVLFGLGPEIEMHNSNHAVISSAISVLRASLKKTEEKVLFNTNTGVTIPAVLLSIGLLVAACAADGGQNVGMASFICVWLTIWSLAVGVMLVAEARLLKKAFTSQSHRMATAGQATISGIFMIPFLGGEILGLVMLVKSASLLVALLLVGTAFIHILFHYWMKAPTQKGRAVLDKIEGFKMFLTAVEGDRLNRMTPPEKTPQLFEKFLPYALALDVEQAWAEKFSGVLDAAGRAPGGSGAAYSPAWYSGSGFGPGGACDFTGFLGGAFSSAISSSAHAPGSGGSGGGGSGGGGGGGGGGGW
ncbi:MAG TPA: DUF2207 domain-containing protein [Verrucomicrobiae bacterium]|nr:DUF2207 domain-containing protein [Verrucomicrobiae bacterium]